MDSPSTPPEIVIRPIAGSEHVDPRRIWEYRHLLASMVRRDLRMKFDALHLGFLWSTARPLLMVLMVTLFRGLHTGEQIGGLPFPLFLYLGLVSWFFFAESVNESALAVQRDAGVISKVYFPRIISPMVSVAANLVDLGVGMVPVVGFLWYFKIMPGWTLVWLPLVVVVMTTMALGAGLLFSRLITQVRDFERVLQLLIYVGMFASPVFYPITGVPPNLHWLVLLNPMAGPLLAMRGCFVADATLFPFAPFATSIVAAIILLALGVFAFRSMQQRLLEML